MSDPFSPELFYEVLNNNGVGFFVGVPDSLLKDICHYINDNVETERHIIAANEGNALAIGIGYHLATDKIPLVYMQNSGLGNIINPLLSLADPDVYSIPALLMIGWRGEPGIKDEPQHKKQGRVMLDMLDAMEIPFDILDSTMSSAKVVEVVENSILQCKTSSATRALVISKGFFEQYTPKTTTMRTYELTREKAIEIIVDALDDTDVIVSTTGLASRELYEHRNNNDQGHSKDFLTVGGMGHANQIALGLALNKPDRRVVCLDGDGALLMHMGSMAIIAATAPANLLHILLNNGAHDSVGGQDTVALDLDMQGVAKNMGYRHVYSVSSKTEVTDLLSNIPNNDGPVFIQVKVQKGWRKDMGRPLEIPVENKRSYMRELLA